MKRLMKLMMVIIMAAAFLIPANAAKNYKLTIDFGEGTYQGKHNLTLTYPEGEGPGDKAYEIMSGLQAPKGTDLYGFALAGETEITFNGEDFSNLKLRRDISLAAVYVKVHTVTLDANAQDVVSWTSSTQKVGEGVHNSFYGIPENADKSVGFAGWSTKKTGEPQYSNSDLEGLNYTKDMTFYAIYKPAVTVTLKGNGGTFWVNESDTVALSAPKGYGYGDDGYIPSVDGKYFEGWSKTKNGKVEIEDLTGYVFNQNTTLYAVYREMVRWTSYNINESITMHVGEILDWSKVVEIQPANADFAIIAMSDDASVLRHTSEGTKAFREGYVEMYYMFQSEQGYKDGKFGVTVLPEEVLDLVFKTIDGKQYWYEKGVKQGTMNDPKNIIGDGTPRGREIYDPASDGWYWLDAIYDGAKAEAKEVWMPYIYQDEDSCSDGVKRAVAQESDPGMGDLVYQYMKEKKGKWVRYDNNGKMLKGWVKIEGALAKAYPKQAGNEYYYDTRTGLMAKGHVKIDGVDHYFDEITGVKQY